MIRIDNKRDDEVDMEVGWCILGIILLYYYDVMIVQKLT